MLDWLHSFSNLQIGAIIFSGGLILTTLAPYAARRYFSLEPSENVAKGAEESLKVAISVAMLILAFCLVRMQGDHRSTEDLVSREAAVILKLDRGYKAFGGEAGHNLHELLVRYASAVVKDEWKLLPKGKSLEAADVLLNSLGSASKKLDPQTPAQLVARSEIIQSFNQLSDLHDARVAASRLSLPSYYWYAIASALTIFAVLGWLQRPLSKQLLYVGGVTCALCLLLTMLIVTAGIFAGESAVNSEPIQRAIQSMVK